MIRTLRDIDLLFWPLLLINLSQCVSSLTLASMSFSAIILQLICVYKIF